MGQNYEAFTPWAKHRENIDLLWETPDVVEPCTKDELLGYIDLVIACVGKTVDGLDIDCRRPGFPWPVQVWANWSMN